MVRIQFPGQSDIESPALAATVHNGFLVEVRSRPDLARLIDLCGEVGFPRSWTFGPSSRRLLPENFYADPFSQLLGALMAGALSSADQVDTPEDPDVLGERVLKVNPLPDRPVDGLLVALATVYQLWNPDDDLVVLLGLAFPAARGADEVSLELSKPRAALWMAPGSLLAGLSLGTALKAAKWCAIVASPFTATTAEAASKGLVERLRDLAQARSKHPPFPRLDALVAQDRAALQGRPVLIVLLHGLLSTDLHTFDGFISQLQQTTPAELQKSLSELQASDGIKKLSADLQSTLTCDRLGRVTDIELRRFVDANVALLGWPHDSLAPIETSAIRLAALLDKELKAAPPRHIVFICHSQGGLLARETALQLNRMKSPANWASRVALIATFGTPHDGAAIAEPGFKGGREIAVYLMMLNGTKQATSLRDVLTILGERVPEGIENLKPFNAATDARPQSFVAALLAKEKGQIWPDGRNWPNMLVVGGELNQSQNDSWQRRLAAGFMWQKLRNRSHDLVVELSSSTASVLAPDVIIRVDSDHFSYFDGQGRSKWAVDAAVAFVWTLLAPEIIGWCDELAASDKARQRAMSLRIDQLKRERQPPPRLEQRDG